MNTGAQDVLRLPGALDLSAAEGFLETIRQQLKLDRALCLDASDVETLTLPCIQIILATVTAYEVSIVNPSAAFASAFHDLALDWRTNPADDASPVAAPAAVEPVQESRHESQHESQPMPAPEAVTESPPLQPVIEPEAANEPEALQPAPMPEPVIELEPEQVAQPASEPEPPQALQPVLEPELMNEPEPEQATESVSEPAPLEASQPMPEPANEPQPEQVMQLVSEPLPLQELQPEPVSEPQPLLASLPEPEPVPAAAPEPSPVIAVEQESIPTPTDEPPMSKRILTIDDSKTMRDMLLMTLAEAGFDVLQAVDGQDGLDVLGKERVDVVITDINMPIMDGYDVIRNLRKDPIHKRTPILVLTTESDTDKRAIARDAGATGWMVKPFDPDRLIATIRKVAP